MDVILLILCGMKWGDLIPLLYRTRDNIGSLPSACLHNVKLGTIGVCNIITLKIKWSLY